MIIRFFTPRPKQIVNRGVALSMVAAIALLSSCARDPMTTASVPADYRQRHPIVLSEAQHSLDIPVAVGGNRLPPSTRENIQGFAQNYKAASSGIVQIQLPQGSANAGAADALRKEIRQALVTSGVEAGKIVETRYQADSANDAAPIRLSYIAMTAMTGQCGTWPEDLANDTVMNRNWYNFGCASQNNLAAQIANPMDLMGPRGVSPVDPARRSNVIDAYRTSGTLYN